MDLAAIIRALYEHKERLDHAIAALEAIQRAGLDPESRQPEHSPGRRGRRSMGAEERLQVSERMRAYWARQKNRS